jgi:hypothetical protein
LLQRGGECASLLPGTRNQHSATGKWFVRSHRLRLLRHDNSRSVDVFQNLDRPAA